MADGGARPRRREKRMSTRNLDRLFAPRSVAVVGASMRPGRTGTTVWEKMRAGGFRGDLWPVNPKYDTIGGLRCFPGVGRLPGAPDLAVLCTPPATIPALVARLGALGTRAVAVVTALRELGREQGRRPGEGDARGGQAAHAARPGAELRRPSGAGRGAERGSRDRDGAARQAGLRFAVGSAGQRGAGLGGLARHRVLAFRVAGGRGRHRPRRPDRLPRRGPADRRDPRLHGSGHLAAQVHVGGAGRGAQQTGGRREVGPCGAGRARGGQPHRRDARRGRGVRRGDPARRDAAGRLHRGPVRRGVDARAHAAPGRRGAGNRHQRRGPGRDGGGRTRRGGPAGGRTVGRDRRRARPGAAVRLVARQPGRHRRRRRRTALRRRRRRPAAGPGGRCAAADPRADRAGLEFVGRAGAAAADRRHRRAPC